MQHDGKDLPSQADDDAATRETANDNGMLGEALTQAGFTPAKVGRKVIAQGRPREKLKRLVPQDPD